MDGWAANFGQGDGPARSGQSELLLAGRESMVLAGRRRLHLVGAALRGNMSPLGRTPSRQRWRSGAADVMLVLARFPFPAFLAGMSQPGACLSAAAAVVRGRHECTT